MCVYPSLSKRPRGLEVCDDSKNKKQKKDRTSRQTQAGIGHMMYDGYTVIISPRCIAELLGMI